MQARLSEMVSRSIHMRVNGAWLIKHLANNNNSRAYAASSHAYSTEVAIIAGMHDSDRKLLDLTIL